MNPGGPLPDGWAWTTLGEACVINPRRPRGLDLAPDEPVTFIPMNAVDDEHAMVARPQTRPYGEVSRGYTYMEEGDVIFAKITPCMQNGKHAIVRETISGIAFGSTEFHVLRATDAVHPIWIHRFLLQPHFLKEAEHNFTGTAGQQRVPKEFLINKSIPLPPLAEQHRIVAALETQLAAAERARHAALSQLNALEAMPAALLRKVFDATPSRSRSRWRRVALGEIANYVNGRAFKPSDWETVGDRIVRIQNLTNPQAVFHRYSKVVMDKHRINDGDLLVAWSASLGVHIWNRGPAILNQHIFKVEEHKDRVDKTYLYHVLRSVMASLKAQAHGATMQHVTKPRFESTTIPLPPLDEQRRIVARLKREMAATERARTAARERLALAEALAGAILRRAFAPGAPHDRD